MVPSQSGRTLLETLGVLLFAGIFAVSGLQLYAKAMNTIRVNYIMEQVFIKATELVENKVANRHKMADISMTKKNTLSYGYSFCSANACKPRLDVENNEFIIEINGIFSTGLCKILKKKMEMGTYPGLKSIHVNLTKLGSCPNEEITSMIFTINAGFKK